MKVKNKKELKTLIEIFLNATSDTRREPVYLLEGKFYRLESISNCKHKEHMVCLTETDINGNYKDEKAMTTTIDASAFISHAKVYNMASE